MIVREIITEPDGVKQAMVRHDNIAKRNPKGYGLRKDYFIDRIDDVDVVVREISCECVPDVIPELGVRYEVVK